MTGIQGLVNLFLLFLLMYHYQSISAHLEGTAGRERASRDFYSFEAVDITGNKISLNRYRGKVSLVVNVASECGFTDRQYKGLVQLHNKFSGTGKFNVLAFPCNQFGNQEPKSNEEILKFAKDKYGVKFQMFSKINVIGDSVPDYWQHLRESSGKDPDWNFWKYLVDFNGAVLEAWGPWTDVEEIFSTVNGAIDGTLSAGGAEIYGPKRPAMNVKAKPSDKQGKNIVGPPPTAESPDGNRRQPNEFHRMKSPARVDL